MSPFLAAFAASNLQLEIQLEDEAHLAQCIWVDRRLSDSLAFSGSDVVDSGLQVANEERLTPRPQCDVTTGKRAVCDHENMSAAEIDPWSVDDQIVGMLGHGGGAHMGLTRTFEQASTFATGLDEPATGLSLCKVSEVLLGTERKPHRRVAFDNAVLAFCWDGQCSFDALAACKDCPREDGGACQCVASFHICGQSGARSCSAAVAWPEEQCNGKEVARDATVATFCELGCLPYSDERGVCLGPCRAIVESPFRDETSGKCVAEQRRKLELCALIPPPESEETSKERAIVFPEGFDDWTYMLQQFKMDLMCQDVRCLGTLHVATAKALQDMAVWNRRDRVQEMRLYVDGSFVEGADRAGWAVVAIGLVGCRWELIGYFSDRLFDKGHVKWIGNETVSAHVAELVAMTCALVVVNANACVCTRCDIVYDAESAAGVAVGVHACNTSSVLAQATTALAVRAWRCGVLLCFRHTYAHQGDPFNEFADIAAKATTRACAFAACSFGDCLARVVVGQIRDWVWLLGVYCGVESFPAVDEANRSTIPVHPRMPVETAVVKVGSIPGIPQEGRVKAQAAQCPATWRLTIATYNALTTKAEARRQALDQMFGLDGVHLLGLQESRESFDGVRHLRNYACFGSSADKGCDGCQIWICKNLPVARREDGAEIFLEWRKVVVVVRQPKLLCVTVPAGGMLFAVFVGHAFTGQASECDIQAWWSALDSAMRAIPRKALPLLLLDANAKFQIRNRLATARDGEPDGLNAQHLARLLEEHELTTQCLKDVEGVDLVTWRSPSGGKRCLDYVALPLVLGCCTSTIGVPANFVDMLGHDHLLVAVECCWTQGASAARQKQRWDTDKMKSQEGRAMLQQVFRCTPCVDWEAHVDDHLQVVNEHIVRQVSAHFVLSPARPRTPHISDEQWSAIRERRCARRVVHRVKVAMARDLLLRCLNGWRGTRVADDMMYIARRGKSWLLLARLGRLVKSLGAVIGKIATQDAASHVRVAFREARSRGESQLAGLLRNVMKTGRRYRRPTLTPALVSNGVQLVDKDEILHALGCHFAEAEQGREILISDLCSNRCAFYAGSAPVQADDLISLPELANGFLNLQLGRAPGLSGIPAEAYQGAAREAAYAHWPIVAKAMLRQTVPFAWSGTLVTGIEKPGKNPGTVQGWRSIALYEAAAKGVAKAFRERMLPVFDRIAHDVQCGARRGCPIELPSHVVRTYVQAACRQGLSGGILFLDGRSAYYATLREHLIGVDALSDVGTIQDLLHALHPDPNVRDELFATLFGQGLLEAHGTPLGVCGYIRASMKQSWFALQPESGYCFHTSTGTVPGTPLADLLYQEVQTVFLSGLKQKLAEHDIVAKSLHGHSKAPVPCWADDVAVLLPYCTAPEVLPNLSCVAREAEHCSRSTGVRLNFESGKTEALVILRGEGSLSVRRHALTSKEPAIAVVLSNGQEVQLRLVQHYDHLGGRVCHNGTCLADIQRRGRIAEGVFKRLYSTLLRNAELSKTEKLRLLQSLVVRKFLFGSGLWCLRTKAEERALNATIMGFYRRAMRPVLGLSSKHLCDNEVCCLLDALSPLQLHRVELVRQLRVVVLQGPGFLWDTVCEAFDWLNRAFEALEVVLQKIGMDWQLEVGWIARLEQLQLRHEQMKRLPKPFAKKIIDDQAEAHEAALLKAIDLRIFERGHGLIFNVPVSTEGQFPCQLCERSFRTSSARAAHAYKKHGIQAVCTRLAYGSKCERCGVEYWDTKRLRRHLQIAAECRAAYEGADLDESAEHVECGVAWRPPVAIEGPKPFWCMLKPLLPDDGQQVSHEDEAAKKLVDLVEHCEGDLQHWFGKVLSWFASFGRSYEGFVSAKRHPRHALFQIAHSLQTSGFCTFGEDLRVGNFCVSADGVRIFLRSEEV